MTEHVCEGTMGLVIRVVLVDDQPLMRMGLRTMIEVEPDLDLVGEAGDGAAALDLIRATTPDVALMDVRMPGLDGLDALGRITADPQLRGCRVVILTTFELDEYVFEALRRGAAGFLTKDAEPAELLRGIRVVAAGEALLSPKVTRRVIERFGGAAPTTRPVTADLSTLTDREREIVGWVATGLSNDEIAAALVVSPATVRTHVSRALTKLNARDRAQLVVLAYQSGLDIPRP
ncbi:DNA-binding response regulator [Virgisporangium aurantiacum]|uniref:DNA-binding response regulator n=1 Tax=Virgisporangium aurantiacum TaxID=175570 RepID=A0A8J4E3K8_9ACTN|nr:DNA-binding response regulator [Virgisporangium aurantiacum]